MRHSLPVLTNGAIFYQGPSQINGAPIWGIATGLRQMSENTKTGGLIQTYILSQTELPSAASKSGQDESVCGDCIHRQMGGAGSCYVNLGQAADQTWKKSRDGTYRPIEPISLARQFPRRKWRLGSYGDPCAIPREVWDDLLAKCDDRIGYTHQWQKPVADRFHDLLMASVETPAQMEMAWKRGWRTYRTRLPGEAMLPGEIECPASEEKQHSRTCETCMACDGRKGTTDRRVSIVITVHGLSWKKDRYARMRRKKDQKKRFRVKGG